MFGDRTWPALWLVWCFLAPLLLVKVCAEQTRHGLTASHSLHSESSDASATCAVSLTASHLTDATHFTIIGNTPWVAGFLRATSVPVTLLRAEGEHIPVLNLIYDVIFLVIDIAGNSTTPSNIFRQLRKSYANHLRVVIWWQSGDIQKAIGQSRLQNVARLVVVNASSSDHQVYGFRDGCEKTTTTVRGFVLGKCGDTNFLKAGTALFPDLERWNYSGCPLRLLVTPNYPHLILTRRFDGEYSLTGKMSVLTSALAKKVNASFHIVPAYVGKSKKKKQDWDLRQHQGAILGNVNSVDNIRLFYKTCVVLYVPSGLGTRLSPFAVLHREFTPAVWALLAAVCLLVVMVLTLSSRGSFEHPEQYAAFFLVSSLAGNSLHVSHHRNGARILMPFWLIFCIVMSTAYQAVLHSLQSAPEGLPEINSLRELVDSNLYIQGSEFFVRDFERLSNGPEGNSTFFALRGQLWVEESKLKSFQQVAFTRNVAVLFTRISVAEYIRSSEKRKGHKLVHEIPGFCLTDLFMNTFRTPRGSRLAPPLASVMDRAFDVGLLDYLHREDEYQRQVEAKQGWMPLGLARLYAVFYLLGCGVAFATLSFMVEMQGA